MFINVHYNNNSAFYLHARLLTFIYKALRNGIFYTVYRFLAFYILSYVNLDTLMEDNQKRDIVYKTMSRLKGYLIRK